MDKADQLATSAGGDHGSEGRARHLAEGVRSACLRAAQDAYEDAGLRGLCAEGRWECALDAIRSLALTPLLHPDETELRGGPRAEDA